MSKFLFILAVGVAIGYSYGWKDAQVNEQAVYERVVDRIGGDDHDLVRNDVDRQAAASAR